MSARTCFLPTPERLRRGNWEKTSLADLGDAKSAYETGNNPFAQTFRDTLAARNLAEILAERGWLTDPRGAPHWIAWERACADVGAIRGPLASLIVVQSSRGDSDGERAAIRRDMARALKGLEMRAIEFAWRLGEGAITQQKIAFAMGLSQPTISRCAQTWTQQITERWVGTIK